MSHQPTSHSWMMEDNCDFYPHEFLDKSTLRSIMLHLWIDSRPWALLLHLERICLCARNYLKLCITWNLRHWFSIWFWNSDCWWIASVEAFTLRSDTLGGRHNDTDRAYDSELCLMSFYYSHLLPDKWQLYLCVLMCLTHFNSSIPHNAGMTYTDLQAELDAIFFII